MIKGELFEDKGKKKEGGESRPDMAKKVVVEMEDEMVRR